MLIIDLFSVLQRSDSLWPGSFTRIKQIKKKLNFNLGLWHCGGMSESHGKQQPYKQKCAGPVWPFRRILNKDFHKCLSTTVLETAGKRTENGAIQTSIIALISTTVQDNGVHSQGEIRRSKRLISTQMKQYTREAALD